jgi:hypothetical protein
VLDSGPDTRNVDRLVARCERILEQGDFKDAHGSGGIQREVLKLRGVLAALDPARPGVTQCLDRLRALTFGDPSEKEGIP